MAKTSRRGRRTPPQARRKPLARKKAVAPAKTRETDLKQQLAEARAQQAATAAILKVIARSPSDVQPVLDAIVRSVLRMMKGATAHVTRLEDDQLHLVAFSKTDAAGVAALKRMYPRRFAGTPGGEALAVGTVLVIADMEKDPRVSGEVRAVMRARGVRSAIVVPMMRKRAPLGTIVVNRKQAGLFSAHEVRLLETFADQAVIAIENVRLFNETKEALERQTASAEILRVIASATTDTQPVFDAIVESAQRLIPGKATHLLLRRESQFVLSAYAGPKMGQIPDQVRAAPLDREKNFPSRAILDREVVHVTDWNGDDVPQFEKLIGKTYGIRSGVLVPLLREGEGIGAIVVTRQAAGPYDQKEIALLQSFADQAVIAIENVRLFNETREALERQTATAEILKVIASSPSDVQPVFDAIVETAKRLIGAFSTTVTRVGDGMLHLVAHTATTPEGEEALNRYFPIRIERNAMGRAIQSRRPEFIDDFEADSDDARDGRDLARLRGFRSVAFVPLIRGDVAIGSLNVTRREAGRMPDHQIGLLKTFADQAVIAIENVRLFKELEARNRDVTDALEQQTATADILRVISSSPTNVQPVFDAIVQSGLKIFAGTSIGITVADGDRLRVVAAGGIVSQVPVGLTVPRSRESATGMAVAEMTVVNIRDTEAPDAPLHARDNGRTLGFRAIAAIPLLREGEAVGAISLLQKDPGGLSDKQVALLRSFADQAVIAIENVRLFNETKEALERQTATAEILGVISSSPTNIQPVLDTVAERAARLCEATDAVIQLREGDVLRPTAHYGSIPYLPIGGAIRMTRGRLTSRAVLDGKQIHVHDLQDMSDEYPEGSAVAREMGSRTALATPLMREGTAIGTIFIRRKEVRPFSDRQLALVKIFADQAVIAIENVRLFNETKEALERQTATAEILKVIASSPSDVQPVFDAIANSAQRLFGARNAVIVRRVDDMLHLVAHTSTSAEGDAALEKLFPVRITGQGATGKAIASGKPDWIVDVETDPAYSDSFREGARARGYRSLLVVPMLREGTAIGAINITRPEPGEFSDEQVRLLQAFADQAVIAIENVRLFNETKEALERQTATAEILQVIGSSPTDTQPVFDAIVNSGVRLFPGAMISVARPDGGSVRAAAIAHEDSTMVAGWKERFTTPLSRDRLHAAAILDAQLIDFPDAEAEKDGPLGPGVRNFLLSGNRAITIMPMLRGEGAIGAISVTRAIPGPLSDKQIAILRTFADQAVIAIENVRLFNETKEALERQTATADILKVISSSPTDTQPVFEAIVQSGLKLFPDTAVVVTLSDGEQVRLAAIADADPLHAEQWKKRHQFPLTREYMHAVAILDRKVIDMPDAQAYEGGPLAVGVRNFLATGNRAVTIVPMLRPDAVIGTISVIRRAPGPLTEKQIALLRTFADQAVIAIENVRLFNETKEALERQTATAEILQVISSSPTDVHPVFDAIMENALHLCDASLGTAGLYDGESYQHVAQRGGSPEFVNWLLSEPFVPDPAHTVGRMIAERRPVHIPDYRELPAYRERNPRAIATVELGGARTFLAVPMLKDGNAIGGITIRRTEVRPFTRKQVDLLVTFASQAVIAIENVRLFKELQSRTEALTRSVGQLTALGEVGQAISSTLDLETVLKTIVQRAVQLTGLDGGSMYEYDEAAGEFRLQASENIDESLLKAVREVPVRKGEGTIGQTALTLEPAQVSDILDDSYHSGRKDLLVRSGYRAILAVPLLREDHLLGALQVFRSTPGAFAPEIVELLKTFATQSAMAIQNARLFREIAEKGRQLEVASRHKSDFLSSMSHELRTPLNAILGFNEMILGQVYGEVPADMQEPLADIQTSGKHLLRLINNVLDLAKIEAGRMELSLQDYSVHDTVASVHSTLRPLAAEKGVEFLANVPNDVPLAYGDGGRMTQCLMNLAGNSLKFTKAGKVEISVETKDELLVYKVTDTGIGIPPDKIGSLFTEFKQTDATIASEYGGTGLGLSISRKFVEMHGGRIWVESELGKGSAFIIEVPLRVKTI